MILKCVCSNVVQCVCSINPCGLCILLRSRAPREEKEEARRLAATRCRLWGGGGSGGGHLLINKFRTAAQPPTPAAFHASVDLQCSDAEARAKAKAEIRSSGRRTTRLCRILHQPPVCAH